MPGPAPSEFRRTPRGRERIGIAVSGTFRASFTLLHRSTMKHMRNALREYASFVRRKSKDLIRTRKRVSHPGEPPSSHTGWLRRGLRFARYRDPDTYIVGYLRRTGKSRGIPKALEFGGRTTVTSRTRRNGLVTRRAVRVRARPVLQPARAIESRKIPRILRKHGAKIHGGSR